MFQPFFFKVSTAFLAVFKGLHGSFGLTCTWFLKYMFSGVLQVFLFFSTRFEGMFMVF